jgi:hypothetical protein
MTCEEFQRILPELGSGNSLERVAHLRSCSRCAGLLADLNAIARQAKQLQESEEPSARVWRSIAAALRNEGLVSESAIELPVHSAHELEDELHVQSCPACAGALADLEAISEQARLLREAEEPSSRVWNSIEIALRNEGLVRQPQVGRSRIRHAQPRWKLAWLAPLAAAAAVILGTVMFQHGDGRQRSVNQPDLASVAPGNVQDSTKLAAAAEEEQMVRLVADRTPALSAAYEADLKAVNDYIRDAESSARANPQDETARQHLMSAYEQRAMIYEMAMNRSLR